MYISHHQHGVRTGLICGNLLSLVYRLHESLYKQIMDEYILWTLLETYEHYEMLSKEKLSQKTVLQMGNKDIIHQRLKLCLEH